MPDNMTDMQLDRFFYGDVTPTGKLTSTWYADMSAFPLLDDYSIQTEPS